MSSEASSTKRKGVVTRDLKVLASALTGVRPFPAVVEQVRALARDPSTALSDMGRLVEQDVGIATNLLRVANAPASGLTQRCTSVRHAVSLLGTTRVAEVAAAAAALAFVEESTEAHPALAAHALGVAGVAQMLAPIIGLSPDEAFTMGLLHDVGAILVLQSGDPFYDGLIEDAPLGDEPDVDDEIALMGFDHGSLGGEVLRQWRLPAPLPEVVALHHRWEAALDAGGAVAAMVALLRSAEKIASALERVIDPRLDDIQVLFDQEPALGHIGLSREELFRLWPAMRAAMSKTSLPEVEEDVTLVRRTENSILPPAFGATRPSQPLELPGVKTPDAVTMAPPPSAPKPDRTIAICAAVGAAVAAVVACAIVFL